MAGLKYHHHRWWSADFPDTVPDGEDPGTVLRERVSGQRVHFKVMRPNAAP